MSPDREPTLVAILSDAIRRDGPISFARFMELALYHPECGYYTTGVGCPGPTGDFVTAVDAGPHFGRAIARQIEEIDRRCGPFDPFDVVESGAGRGRLARDVLDALHARVPELARRVRYRALDRSRAMRDEARRTAPACEVLAPNEIPAGTLSGVAIAVELFDALPVHRLRRAASGIAEVRVGLDPAGALIEVEGVLSPAIASCVEAEGPEVEFEIAPTLAAVFDQMHTPFVRGVSIVVDYGDRGKRLQRRFPRGTALAYHRHGAHEGLLERPGLQDLTAHVDFTALEHAGAARGWELLGTVSQERFLVTNGILEVFDSPDQATWRDPQRVTDRQQALRLMHPAGMGRVFRTLFFVRGVARPALAALD